MINYICHVTISNISDSLLARLFENRLFNPIDCLDFSQHINSARSHSHSLCFHSKIINHPTYHTIQILFIIRETNVLNWLISQCCHYSLNRWSYECRIRNMNETIILRAYVHNTDLVGIYLLSLKRCWLRWNITCSRWLFSKTKTTPLSKQLYVNYLSMKMRFMSVLVFAQYNVKCHMIEDKTEICGLNSPYAASSISQGRRLNFFVWSTMTAERKFTGKKKFLRTHKIRHT